MNEAYLQELWSLKRIPTIDLCTVDQIPLTILKFGKHNTDLSGPDFLFGGIELHGVKLFGDIEIHVNASDWYKHGHHLDERYNSVILHVVLNNDKQIIQNGAEIPTLELKGIIDKDHYRGYVLNRFRRSMLVCENELKKIDPIYLESMKSKALLDKLNDKFSSFNELDTDLGELFYQLLAQSFGTSINKRGFQSLASYVPYYSIRKLQPNQRFALLISESGVLNNSNKYGEQNLWNYKGTRPANFPTNRVYQFAHLIALLDIDLLILEDGHELFIRNFKEEVINIFKEKSPKERLSKRFIDQLIINAIVPYLWYIGEKKNSSLINERAEDILMKIPAESNRLITKWKSVGLKIINAYDSQSLLALYRYYCNPKKCLSCEVGNKILDRIQ